MTSKNDVLTAFLMIFCQKSGRGATLPNPPLCQSTFQSVSGGRPHRVRGVAGSQLGLFLLLFLNGPWRHTDLGMFPKPPAFIAQ
jgi:hypothetical protein